MPKENLKKQKNGKTIINYESYILKLVDLEENAKFQEQYLRNHPNDETSKDILQEIKKKLKSIKKLLLDNFYFLCPYCNQLFRNKDKMNNHIKFKHNIKSIKCYYCEELFASESELSTHQKSHELDLHGFYLKDAICEVKKKLNECHEKGTKGLILIHGYRHGHTLKSYFRSKSFNIDMRKVGLNLQLFQVENPGFTSVLFKK